MTKVHTILNSFNSGEFSPKLHEATHIQAYKFGCASVLNMIPEREGSLQKRPGTRFLREVKNSANETILIPFKYNINQAYWLELGGQYVRFHRDGGTVLVSGSPYEITSPYSPSDLKDLQYVQSADVMYIVHPDYPPYILSRLSDTSWTLAEMAFEWPPFQDENVTSTTLTIDAVSIGTGRTLTASSALFSADMVGSYVQISEPIASRYDQWEISKSVNTGDYRVYNGNFYEATSSGTTGTRPPVHTRAGTTESDGKVDWKYRHSGEGFVKITGFTSDTVVTVKVLSRVPETALSPGTEYWSLGAWSKPRGYPRAITFYEDRLWFAGSKSSPQTLWGSVSSDYDNFRLGTRDDEAVSYTINSREINPILWIAPSKVLSVGTSGGEFVVRASSLDEAITPSNIKIVPETKYGSEESIAPLQIDSRSLFVQAGGRTLRDFFYDFSSDAYLAEDLNLLAEHIVGGTKIKAMAYQSEPYRVVWCSLQNGNIVAFTYDREQGVKAWHRHNVSGDVESIITTPHWGGDTDVVAMIVKRNIDGSDVRYVEYFEKYRIAQKAAFSDSSLLYEGTATTTISGLDHLEGKKVKVVADGALQNDKTVLSGEITLDYAAEKVVAGLPFTSEIETLPIVVPVPGGISQGKQFRINTINLSLLETGQGLTYGDKVYQEDVTFRTGSDLMDEALPLFTGITEMLVMNAESSSSPSIVLKHSEPLPWTLRAIMIQGAVHEY